MLDLDANRPAVTPTDAATLVLVRTSPDGDGIELFCVERNKKSRFMGGAIVFPGGKLDTLDANVAWAPLTTPARAARGPFSESDAHLRALAIAAIRETLEEAAILHVAGGSVTQEDLFALRARLEADPSALAAFLTERDQKLDLAALHPFARWITPVAESRRFDARFFVALAPEGLVGAHDERETMASFWAKPAEILRRFDAGEVQLMPPTHRTVVLFATTKTAEGALELADASITEPICPKLVRHVDAAGETAALVLPGDPEHDVRDVRTPGPSRYVLRGDRWRSENAPR